MGLVEKNVSRMLSSSQDANIHRLNPVPKMVTGSLPIPNGQPISHSSPAGGGRNAE